MIRVYVNYPNLNITIHSNPACGNLRQQHKQNQRVVSITTSSLTTELIRFERKEYKFGSQADINDMWLAIDLGDSIFEVAVTEHIRKILASHYTPFSRIKAEEHCHA